MTTRKVTPQDVVDAAMQWADGDGELERLSAKIDGLEKLCLALCTVLTPAQQLAAVVQLRGSPTSYECYKTVELTAE